MILPSVLPAFPSSLQLKLFLKIVLGIGMEISIPNVPTSWVLSKVCAGMGGRFLKLHEGAPLLSSGILGQLAAILRLGTFQQTSQNLASSLWRGEQSTLFWEPFSWPSGRVNSFLPHLLNELFKEHSKILTKAIQSASASHIHPGKSLLLAHHFSFVHFVSTVRAL